MDSAVSTAGKPVLKPVLKKERAQFRPRALAQSLSVSATKRTRSDAAQEGKRAAVVLRAGMRQAEFRRIEARMMSHQLASLPIIVGGNARAGAVPEALLCGVIVTGSEGLTRADERAGVVEIVREALKRKAPVLALSDAVELAMEAAGKAAPTDAHLGVLIDGDVRLLATRADIDRAIDAMAASTPR